MTEGGLRRNHSGIDFLARVGTEVVAPMTGWIEGPKNPYKDTPHLNGLRLANENGLHANVFYVKPAPKIEEALRSGKRIYVKAGETVIGHAQDISLRPQNRGIPNHIHVKWEDPKGRAITPDGTIAVQPVP